MNYKRMITKMNLAFALMLCLAVLSACGGCSKSKSSKGEVATTEGAQDSTKSKVYDTGIISVLVPSGWKAFHGMDYFNEFDEPGNPNIIMIGKNVADKEALFSKPKIMLTYHKEKKDIETVKTFYENVVDIKPIEIGDYTWEGFTAISPNDPIAMSSNDSTTIDKSDSIVTPPNYPIADLYVNHEEYSLQLLFTLENGGEKITLDEQDVKDIMKSIKITEKQ